MITQKRLKELVHYDPETGVFTNLVERRGVDVGDTLGSIHTRGYLIIPLGGVKYIAHRLAWLYVYGEFPPNDVDHIDRVRTNNKISNLRLCTQRENNINSSKRKTNRSGYKGVNWDKTRGAWRAQIQSNKKKIIIGRFISPALAYLAYCREGKKLHGEFFSYG